MGKTKARLILYLSILGGVLSVFFFNLLVFSPLILQALKLKHWLWPVVVSALMTIAVFAGMWDPCTDKIGRFKKKHGI